MKNKKYISRLFAVAVTVMSFFNGIPVSAATAPNATMGGAVNLPIGQLVEGSMSSTDDAGMHYRYYKVKNPYNVDSVAEISITNTSTDYGDLYKAVYNSKGIAEDAAATGTWISTSNSVTVYVGLKSKETKYIKLREVYESANESSKYKDKSWTIYTEVKKEEGNSFKKAKAVKAGKTVKGNGNYKSDDDYFKVTPTKSGKMTITFSQEGKYGRYFEIYDKSKMMKKKICAYNNKAQKYNIKVTKGKPVYIKTYPNVGDVDTYRFKTKIK